MSVLEHTVNNFGGVMINPNALPATLEAFEQEMQQSLAIWSQDDLRLVWLELPVAKAAFIPFAVETGFTFHHSVPEQATLVYRLQPDAFIPAYASHYIGVGAVVINEREELLVVCERYHRVDRPRFYKLPGGLVDKDEHLTAAVVREVFEETGVRAQFESLVCFRHWHGARFGKSDIYFICRCSPLSTDIIRNEEEIAECLWMPIEEYLGMGTVSAFNKAIVQAAIAHRGIGTTWIDGHGTPVTHEFYMPFELFEGA